MIQLCSHSASERNAGPSPPRNPDPQSQTAWDEYPRPRDALRARAMPEISPSQCGGRREGRALAAPVARLQKKSRRQSPQVWPNTPGPPCAMVLRLIRALVSAKSARMCERAVLTNRPSLDLSPIALKGRIEPVGERGTGPVSSFNPNSCMGCEPGRARKGAG